ncbi:hypothetical protein V6N13_039062 [Hibiscus sabdariffa]
MLAMYLLHQAPFLQPLSFSPASINISFCFSDDWMQRLFFYEFQYPTSHFKETTLPKLRTSLFLTLQLFFPSAGNLVFPLPPQMPYVLYTEGDSVAFVAYESSADFNHLVGDHSRYNQDFHALVPKSPPAIASSRSNGCMQRPTMAVLVTMFPNVGLIICSASGDSSDVESQTTPAVMRQSSGENEPTQAVSANQQMHVAHEQDQMLNNGQQVVTDQHMSVVQDQQIHETQEQDDHIHFTNDDESGDIETDEADAVANEADAVDLVVDQPVNSEIRYSALSHLSNSAHSTEMCDGADSHMQHEARSTEIGVDVDSHIQHESGVGFSHVAADGRTLAHFMKSWTSLHRCQGDLTCLDNHLPSFNRDSINDPLRLTPGLFTMHHRIFQEGSSSSSSSSSTSNVFVNNIRVTCKINRPQVELLKDWVNKKCMEVNQSDPMRISTFVVTCAYMWVCLIKLQQAKTHQHPSSDDSNMLSYFHSEQIAGNT